MTSQRPTKADKKDIFVVFPYLKTSKPVPVRDILLRSSDDLEALSPEQKNHFKTLFAMFFLREDLHITQMMYAHRELGRDSELDNKWLDRLYEAQLLINYLYSNPHPLGQPLLHQEQVSMYVFQVDNFSSRLIWPDDSSESYSVENLAKNTTPMNENVSGYHGLLNNSSYFWAVAGNRIYPPTLRLSLYPQQDLSLDLLRFWQRPKNWSVVDFLRGREHYDKEFDDRIITAIEWHNRSTAQDITEEEQLLHLAIAFESLLNLNQNGRITDRFRETIMTLLGAGIHLESWLEQFYNARSDIAHKGRSKRLMFLPTHRDKKQSQGKDAGQTPEGYRTLTMYGRRIFRHCLNAILTGATLADEDGLAPLFVSNQERLVKICERLRQTTETPEKRLRSIAKEVSELHEHWYASEKLVQLETLTAAGKLVVETYAETKPQLTQEADIMVREVLQRLKRNDISAIEKLQSLEGFTTALSQRQAGNTASPANSDMQQSFTILTQLLNYVASPEYHFVQWYQSQVKDA